MPILSFFASTQICNSLLGALATLCIVWRWTR